MSGFMGLYDPASGLVGNRNDPRYAMAQKLVDQQTPAAIPGAGASVLTSLSGIARALAAGKLMGDARQDGKDQAAKQDADYKEMQRMLFGGGDAAPAAPTAPTAPVDAAPLVPPGPAPAAGGGGGPIVPPAHLLPIYQKAAADTGIPLPLLLAQGNQESGFNPGVVGAAGERGVNQVLGTTGAQPGYGLPPLSPEDAADPAKSIPWGAQYMAARGKAAGVTDWNDPAQQRVGLARYNGAGPAADRYAQTVAGAMPRVQIPGAAPAAPLSLPGTGIQAQPGTDAPPGLPPAFQQAAAAGVPANPQPAASLATPTASPTMGDQMAGKLGGGAWQPTPAGAAMASRIDPAAVAAAQRKAAIAATSNDPRIARLAPQFQAQAQQLQAQAERQEMFTARREDAARADARQAADRADAERRRTEDEARRRAERIEDRVPLGYRKTADGNLEKIKGGPADQADSPKAPVGYRFTQDGKSLEFIPNGPADPALKEKPAKMPSDTVVKGVTGNMTALRNLDSALAAVDAAPDAFGASNYVPGIDRFAPQPNIAARGKVADIGSLVLHERSGAAVSVSEMERLKPFIPAATDTPDQVRTKLRSMRERVAGMLQEQYEVYGPSNGYRAIPGHGRALGVDDEGRATAGADAGGPPPAPPSAPAANPNATPAAGRAGPDPRKLAAVEAARKALGPNATDDDVLRKAQELFGR